MSGVNLNESLHCLSYVLVPEGHRQAHIFFSVVIMMSGMELNIEQQSKN